MLNQFAIIIPSLNPDDKFVRVLLDMIENGFSRFVIVDDGSDDNHQEPFNRAKDTGKCVLLKHETNIGKGQALKDAFNYVYDNMPEIEYVITIDGDGQHTPKDAIRLAEYMENHKDDVVFGCRNFDLPNVPTHNKLGNKITANVFKLFFGMNISDAQTGLRGIPRKYLKDLVNEVEGTRFEYESNVLIYMSEKNIPFSEISIDTVYLEDNKSSHFRPFQDSIRIYKPILSKSKSFMYALSAIICTLIDSGCFTILNSLFSGISILFLQTLLTTGLARIISSVCNFVINKKYVFRSDANTAKSGSKYAILVVVVYLCSWVLSSFVFKLTGAMGFARTILKLLVDLTLAVLSYFAQKKWVFK